MKSQLGCERVLALFKLQSCPRDAGKFAVQYHGLGSDMTPK